MSLRRTAATAALTVALTSGGALASIPSATAAFHDGDARAAAPGCVTKAEFRRVKKGMTVAKVKKVFGAGGAQVLREDLGAGGVVTARRYRACTSPRGAVGVSFVARPGQPAKLAAKEARWR